MADAVLEQRFVVGAGAVALVFLVVFGLLIFLALFALLGKAVDRWRRGDINVVDDQVHDVGPDSLRLIEDLDAHMKAYGAAVADYYDTTTGDQL